MRLPEAKKHPVRSPFEAQNNANLSLVRGIVRPVLDAAWEDEAIGHIGVSDQIGEIPVRETMSVGVSLQDIVRLKDKDFRAALPSVIEVEVFAAWTEGGTSGRKEKAATSTSLVIDGVKGEYYIVINPLGREIKAGSAFVNGLGHVATSLAREAEKVR